MAIQKIKVEEFIQLAQEHLLFDVRSEGEYDHAHIPAAINLPLFDNEERKIVGTAYKQQSRQEAIKKGLAYFGPKMRKMVEEVERRVESRSTENKAVLVHCWRGGMRSAGIAWLLDLYGFKVYTLVGGYKAFRNWAIEQFNTPTNIFLLGGYTGSGKTIVLEQLQQDKASTVDLEGLAGHKGSAFGRIGLPQQPSQEMFENKLGLALYKSRTPGKGVWIEDESQRIGSVNIPQNLWIQMRNSPVYFLDIPFDERLNYLVKTYGLLDQKELGEAIGRIQKRLGGLETKTAQEHLQENNIAACFSILLKYYDKLYAKSLEKRPDPKPQVTRIEAKSVHAIDNTAKLKKSTDG